jgi:hypothetical protein
MNETAQEGGKPNEGEHIDISDPNDMRHWTRELRVDERTLKVAVREAGPSVSAVRHYLNTSRIRR